jgi:hypothetical protein
MRRFVLILVAGMSAAGCSSLLGIGELNVVAPGAEGGPGVDGGVGDGAGQGDGVSQGDGAIPTSDGPACIFDDPDSQFDKACSFAP